MFVVSGVPWGFLLVHMVGSGISDSVRRNKRTQLINDAPGVLASCNYSLVSLGCPCNLMYDNSKHSLWR